MKTWDSRYCIKIIKKKGFLRDQKILKIKTKSWWNTFSAANKVSKADKNKSDFNYDPKYAFYRFYRDFEKFKKVISLNSMHGELKNYPNF